MSMRALGRTSGLLKRIAEQVHPKASKIAGYCSLCRRQSDLYYIRRIGFVWRVKVAHEKTKIQKLCRMCAEKTIEEKMR